MSKHTPLPWRITVGLNTGYISSDYGFVPIRTPFRENAFGAEPDSQAMVNGHFIVRAVNSYHWMLDALKAVRLHFIDNDMPEIDSTIGGIVNQAIAEGEANEPAPQSNPPRNRKENP